MKKRIIAAIAAVLLAFSAAAAGEAWAAQEDAAASGSLVLDLSASGVSFVLPEDWDETHGVVLAGDGMEVDTGIYYSTLRYYAFSQEQYDEFLEKGADNRTEEEQDFISSRILLASMIFTMDGDRSLDDFRAWMEELGGSADGYREISTVGEYHFFGKPDPVREYIEDGQLVLEGEYQEEYESLLKALEEPGTIEFYEPGRDAAKPGDEVLFTTVDLEGNEVDSRELFGSHSVTLVNIWTTYCTWCLKEMPDLEALSQEMAEKGCGVIGIVADVSGSGDTAMLEEAQELVEMTGVTYPNLIPWEGFYTKLPAAAVPTTYFVDSQGRVLGDPVVGAREGKEYKQLLLELLQNAAPVRAESGAAEGPEFLYVQTETLYAYAEPSEDSEVLLALGEGTCIPVAEAGEDGWYAMSFTAEDETEQTAWVHNTEAGELSEEALLPEDGYTMFVISDEAEIFADPSEDAEVLETRGRGRSVTVRGMTFDGNWSGISCGPDADAEIGWIRAEDIDSIFWDEAGVVTPQQYLIDPSMLDDGIYAAAFPKENLMNIGSGLTLVDAEIFTEDVYDIVDIATLQPGMYLYMDGEYMKVETIKEGDYLEINGGYYEGGCSLGTWEDSNGWHAVIEDDHTTYTSHGKATLVLAENAVFTDTSDPEGEVVTAEGIDEIMPLFDAMDHGDFNRYNTTIRVENGEIAEINRRYIP